MIFQDSFPFAEFYLVRDMLSKICAELPSHFQCPPNRNKLIIDLDGNFHDFSNLPLIFPHW